MVLKKKQFFQISGGTPSQSYNSNNQQQILQSNINHQHW